jgi:carbon storage regulator
MLILTRSVKESVYVGDSIVVQVLSIKGNCVRLGLSAPPEVRILRSELTRRSSARPQPDGADRFQEPGCDQPLGK